MFRFESFGSGSSGNSYYLQTEEGGIFIDAGVGIRKLKKYLHEYGVSLGKTRGVLVTHNHVDHVRCLGILNQKEHLPVFLTEEVMAGIKENPVITKKPLKESTHYIEKEKSFEIIGLEVTPFEVPHDSKDNVGYMIKHNETVFCIVTDCGHLTSTIEKYIEQASFLVLESNYDPDMLAHGPYPVFLQNRIRNGYGHLANNLAADIINRHQHHLKRVWLCHLSEKNNTPELALKSAQNALEKDSHVIIEALDRFTPSRLYDLE